LFFPCLGKKADHDPDCILVDVRALLVEGLRVVDQKCDISLEEEKGSLVSSFAHLFLDLVQTDGGSNHLKVVWIILARRQLQKVLADLLASSNEKGKERL